MVHIVEEGKFNRFKINYGMALVNGLKISGYI